MRLIPLAILCLLPWTAPGLAVAAEEFSSTPNTEGGFQSGFDNTNSLIAQDEFLPVEEAYILNAEFENRDGNTLLRLNWRIAEGYYLYRHGFSFALSADGQPYPIQAVIPDGKEKQDEYFGLVQVYYHGVDIDIPAIPAESNLILEVASQGCADAGLCYPPRTQYFRIDGQQQTVVETGKPTPVASAPQDQGNNISSGTSSAARLPMILLLALLGGAILNLMPCVFPVLSLKVLGFANDKGHSPAVHGLTYTAGVVVSFVAVAAVLISLQTAGEAVGWGFQLQSPWFVAALCYLFFVMGLSLSGFVEFGGQWMNLGGRLAAQSGYGGSFFTGVLATVVASPCTAPFMGTALGFAATQPPLISLSIFATLGFGMALPILILSCSPALLKYIPRPGPWMEKLKQALAFPLYATAIWLSWVVGKQTGVNGMATLLIGVLLIVLALWLWRSGWMQRGFSAVCTTLALALLASSLLQAPSQRQGEQPLWQAYSPQLLRELRAQGKPVFVNITADWCITCLTNEKVTLDTNAVKQSLRQSGITYLKGDWTNYDPAITELLREYGRNGIPLYLVFPAGSSDRAEVLPQILTVDTVINALTAAAGPTALAHSP